MQQKIFYSVITEAIVSLDTELLFVDNSKYTKTVKDFISNYREI